MEDGKEEDGKAEDEGVEDAEKEDEKGGERWLKRREKKRPQLKLKRRTVARRGGRRGFKNNKNKEVAGRKEVGGRLERRRELLKLQKRQTNARRGNAKKPRWGGCFWFVFLLNNIKVIRD